MKIPTHYWFDLQPVGDITVIRLIHPQLWGDEQIQSLRKELVHLVKETGRPKLVLNLAAVKSMSSNMIGILAMLNKKTRSADGKLVLCQLQPRIEEVFQVLQLPQLLTICGTDQEALQSFG